MATSSEHVSKAQANESFADQIDTNSSAVAISWIVTIIFYAAVHYVQAYFASLGRKHILHKARSSDIQRDSRIAVMYNDYRDLYDISRDARYDCGTLAPGHIKFAKERLEKIKADLRPFLP